MAGFPWLAYAQLDDNLYLQQAQSSLVNGYNLRGQSSASKENNITGPNAIQSGIAFQSYQDSISMVVNARHQAVEGALQAYTHCITLANQAMKAPNPDDQRKLYGDFLNESGLFLKDHPDDQRLWVMRGAAAVATFQSDAGWDAGKHILALSAKQRENPHIKKLLAIMGAYGWLGKDKPAEPKPVVTAAATSARARAGK